MLLQGKKGLIIGIANNRSIAYGIAKICQEQGADIAITYQGEVLRKRINSISDDLSCKNIYMMDVTDSDSMSKAFADIKQDMGKLDFIVHSVAFSDRTELEGSFIDTSLDNFSNTMNISCYSLVSICKQAENILSDGASIIAMTYYGAEKVIPNYNVMGVAKAALESSVRYLANDLGERAIRVNSISAGPIKTLAASGIGDFRTMLDLHKNTAPLKRNITQEDVAKAALYLLSNLSSGVTGTTHYVDAGYNIMGMSRNK